MAGTDSHKQLLTLIRDFGFEKSQGERRVVSLNKRIEELRAEVEAANAELEETKRFKESTEQELKGYEVELALNESLIKTLEARISLIQNEISFVASEVEALKNEAADSRDEFIGLMYEMNAKIRKFHDTIDCNIQKEKGFGTAAEACHRVVNEDITESASRTLEDMLAHMVSQTTKVEEEYLAEQNIQKQVQLELNDFERKLSLMVMVTRETKALQDLTRYPYHAQIRNCHLNEHG
ncbi:hypothetical protein CFOL_v3_16564 [Cephalotus follicularis]|uniref:Uncharacterized protein n=1 Tax=Cephalotus follicularis TaxID=3775 RepID=A0A1Q3BYN7_CEPFO|nr:hypothetical protein CFOL_v3_16564 [Cephalotus follicularis]